EDARRWLGSSERQSRIEGATPMLVGRDDVHIVRDDASAARAAPVSAVMSTRVKPGMEAEYLKWEQKVAAAQSKAAGLQGYRFEPSVPGVQETLSRSCVLTARPICRPGWSHRNDVSCST